MVAFDELIRDALALLKFIEPLTRHPEGLRECLLVNAEGQPFQAEDRARGPPRERGMGKYFVESSRGSSAHGERIGEGMGTCQALLLGVPWRSEGAGAPHSARKRWGR